MSIVPQNNENEVVVFDCVQRFFSSREIGNLLKNAAAQKKKEPAVFLLRYKLSNVFTGRSIYMQE